MVRIFDMMVVYEWLAPGHKPDFLETLLLEQVVADKKSQRL